MFKRGYTIAIYVFIKKQKKYLTKLPIADIITLAVSILWRCTQEAEEVPLLRV